jgi:hypothetical protein
MSLITDSELAAIRSLGEQGMVTDITIQRNLPSVHDDDNPFGDDDLEMAPASQSVTVKGWLVSHMDRSFGEDGSRIVGVHDITLRVPVGTAIGPRDVVTVAGTTYTVVEANTEDSWPEWTVVYIRRTG